MPTPARSETSKAKVARAAARRQARARLASTRPEIVRIVDAALRDRLIRGAYAADDGQGVDTTGLSDEEFLALLRR